MRALGGRFGAKWASWGAAGALLCLGAVGCAGQGQQTAGSPSRAKAPTVRVEKLPPLVGIGARSVPAETARRVGDVVAHRYSGAFRSQPITVTEEVVAREGDVLVVDFTVEQGDSERTLRARLDAATERVLRVSHLVGNKETPGRLSELDALMAEIAFAPDTNDGKVSSKSETCLVGPRELDCELTKYNVFVDSQPATLAVSRASELARDVSGEVTAVDGTVLYRAELLDVRRAPSVAATSARLETREK